MDVWIAMLTWLYEFFITIPEKRHAHIIKNRQKAQINSKIVIFIINYLAIHSNFTTFAEEK